MSQIAEATAGYKVPNDSASPVLAWASQPGMIRTYDQTGNAFRLFKLYSSDQMVISEPAPEFNVNEEFARDVPDDWFEQPAVFTDLNAPVQSARGRYDYPVVDPTAQKTDINDRDGIEGFEVIRPAWFKGDTRPGPATNPTESPEANGAAMPLRWLYVLRDGTLTPPPPVSGGDNKGVLDWSSVSDPKVRPTETNPIVGRIAMWADDETAKININTASEGTFWDRPWSRAAEETRMAQYIPGQGEFQRYPGHPATTSLSPVLGSIFTNFATYAGKKNYYLLVPRVMDGGTRAGTAVTERILTSDNERLFASVDELAYRPPLRTEPADFRRPPIGVSDPERYRDLLEKSKFFLTAHSRAPDLNLFNQPRISLWPLQFDANTADTREFRNAQDRLIAFCGTTAPNTPQEARYYFQRFSAYYLQGQVVDGRTSFGAPGFFPSSCHPSLDMDESKIPRNVHLYQYLQKLTSAELPGFGGSLKNKYDDNVAGQYSDRDQILTSAVDYIRSSINSYSTSQNLLPQYDYAPTRRGGPVAGETQLVPLVLGRDVNRGQPNALPFSSASTTKGFGRFSTITEIAVTMFKQKAGAGPERLGAGVILEPFNPTPGPASWSPNVRYLIKGLSAMPGDPSVGLKVSGPAFANTDVDMGFPPPREIPTAGGTALVYPFNWITSRVGYSGGGHKMPFMGLQAQFRYFRDGGSDNTKTIGLTGAESTYPFFTVTGPLIAPGSSRFNFNGGLLQIEIYSGFERIDGGAAGPNKEPNPALLVQRINVRFPRVENLLLPTTVETGPPAGRFPDNVIRSGDVVRAVEVRHDGAARGDLRMVCGLAEVPETYFAPLMPEYGNGDTRAVHSLRSWNYQSPGAIRRETRLIPGATTNRAPAAAHAMTAGAVSVAGQGDFDNGLSDFEDGAFVNKADEGNLRTGSASWFDDGSFNVEDGQTHSPNRQIASAVAFGSLPTGVKYTESMARSADPGAMGRPWQTLLFTAQPLSKTGKILNFSSANTQGKHFGFGTTRPSPANQDGRLNQPPYIYPPDHVLLDLFTMPVVEPYAISEPLSTAGRVNLNYQIAPFTNIKRTTALHGVMRSVKIMGIPQSSADKGGSKRFDINPEVGSSSGDNSTLEGPARGTLYGFHLKFQSGDIFRSASQICDIPLVPRGSDYENIDGFWNNNRRTGDNVREIPYGHIYPRVTTKSNTFTVHMRVQALQKVPNSPAAQWDESKDRIAGEYRGSTTLERYIDASAKNLPDFAGPRAVDTDNLDRHYRFRILNTKAFVRQ
jgi:uncharacterized protein (TIGR02600 family)